MPGINSDLPHFADGVNVTREQLNRIVDALRRTSGDFAAYWRSGGQSEYGERFSIEAFPATISSNYYQSEGNQTPSAQYNMVRAVTQTDEGIDDSSLWKSTPETIQGINPQNFIATNLAELDNNFNPLSNLLQAKQQVMVFVLWNRGLAGSGSQGPFETKFYVFWFAAPRFAQLYLLDVYGTALTDGGARYMASVATGTVKNLDPTTNYEGGQSPDSSVTFPGTTDAVFVNEFEGGSSAMGTHVLFTDAESADGSAIVWGEWDGTTEVVGGVTLPVYYGCRGPVGTDFEVLLTNYSMSPMFPYTYNVTGLSGLQLAANVGPQFRSGIPVVSPGTTGIGYIDETGAFHLKYADEPVGVGIPFVVALTQSSGSDGTTTSPPSWTYSAKDLNGNVLAGGSTTLSPKVRPGGNGSFAAATFGLAYIDPTLGFTILIAYETENSVAGC